MGRRGRARSVLTLGLTLALVAGCSSAAPPERVPSSSVQAATSTSTATVLREGSVTVTVPAGATATQTTAHLTESGTSPLPSAATAFATAVGPVVTVDLSGQQPLVPLSLTIPVPAGTDTAHLLLVSDHEGQPREYSGSYDPVTQTFTAAVDALSTFQLAWVDPARVVSTLVATVQSFLTGGAGSRPGCAGKTVTLADGATVQVVGDTAPLWPCLEAGSAGQVKVNVSSTDIVPWQVRSAAGSYDGAAQPAISDAATQALYDALLAGDRRYADGLVLSGDSGTWTVPAAAGDSTLMQGQLSVGGWLAAAIVFSLTYLVDVFSAGQGDLAQTAREIDTAVTSKTGLWDCVAGAATTWPPGSAVSTSALAAVAHRAVGCVDPVTAAIGSPIGALAKIVLDIVGTGAAVVAGGLLGAVRTVSGRSFVTWRVQASGGIQRPGSPVEPRLASFAALAANPCGLLTIDQMNLLTGLRLLPGQVAASNDGVTPRNSPVCVFPGSRSAPSSEGATITCADHTPTRRRSPDFSCTERCAEAARSAPTSPGSLSPGTASAWSFPPAA